MHRIEKHSAGQKSGIIWSMKVTSYGLAEVSRLGGGIRNVYIFCNDSYGYDANANHKKDVHFAEWLIEAAHGTQDFHAMPSVWAEMPQNSIGYGILRC